jgi:hypothetical protein
MFHRAKATVCFEINTAHIDAVWAERTIFRCVRKISKSDSYFRRVYPSVSLSAWNNSASNGRIFMKFRSSLFFEHLSRKFKFH